MFEMPRGPRLDAPGVLHHVMARGIMRQAIFRDNRDRNDFVTRLGELANSGAFWSEPHWLDSHWAEIRMPSGVVELIMLFPSCLQESTL